MTSTTNLQLLEGWKLSFAFKTSETYFALFTISFSPKDSHVIVWFDWTPPLPASQMRNCKLVRASLTAVNWDKRESLSTSYPCCEDTRALWLIGVLIGGGVAMAAEAAPRDFNELLRSCAPALSSPFAADPSPLSRPSRVWQDGCWCCYDATTERKCTRDSHVKLFESIETALRNQVIVSRVDQV